MTTGAETEPRPRSALDELHDDPSSRKRFLRAIGGGAAAATFSLVLAACGSKKTAGNQFGGAGVGTAQFGQGDAGIVAFALYLEYLETDLYDAVQHGGHLTGRELELAKRFGSQEHGHVTTLEGTVKALGGKAPARPKSNFVLGGRNETLRTINQVEALGAAAYLGQLDRIQSKQVLAAALSIHSVEARHAAVLQQLLGLPISPDGAFGRGVTSVEVASQTRQFVTG